MTTATGQMTWREISDASRQPGRSIYDWCWVCGAELGPDKLHVMIDNGRVLRHTYCCRKHRYVVVDLGRGAEPQVQARSDHEIEALSWAFKDGKLSPGWE